MEWGSKEGKTQKNHLYLCQKGKTEVETKGSREVNIHKTKTPISTWICLYIHAAEYFALNCHNWW